MATPQADSLLERAKSGEHLKAPERRHCLAWLMVNEHRTNEELVQLFGVSRRQIQLDKEKIRRDVANELKVEDVALVIADIRLCFLKTLREIQKGTARAALGTGTHLKYCLAEFQLQMDFITGLQTLGVYPRELGTIHVDKFEFTATAALDLSRGIRAVQMFDEPVTIDSDRKQLTNGNKNLQAVSSSEG